MGVYENVVKVFGPYQSKLKSLNTAYCGVTI